ncbi:hypothetical protein WN944_026970 [Citrus x changshan-huyou]|uniref:HAT C-terminal dimerisation domain-containing protein n=1 Tax=Citrus x changshan-huyou TaxID=2935761 RepID=A0AAP0QCI6_9ROSI
MDFVMWRFNSMCETKKVEELCHSLNELLMKLYGSYSFGDPNNAANTSYMVQNSEISECAVSNLSQIAKDISTIPVSAIASESTFSIGGCVLDPFWSSLTPKTIDDLY